MIAYLLLVHQYPDQFKKLFNAIYHKDNHYLIHIDKKSSAKVHTEVTQFLSNFPNVSILKSQIANWGGYSLVDVELKGIKKLLKMNSDWQFFINLSGQDLPLKTQDYIHEYLNKHEEHDFLKVANQYEARPETLNRIENFVEESENTVNIIAPHLKRPFLSNAIPYIGNQWMILSRKFCEFITNNPEVDRFIDFYKNTLIADESFFQTVMMNTSYKNKNIIRNDMREIDWVQLPGEIKLRPRNYTIEDTEPLFNSHNLFARKFDETIDNEIILKLEEKCTNLDKQNGRKIMTTPNILLAKNQ